MAITFVAVGANSANNNADGSPSVPSGYAASDFFVLAGLTRGLDADANSSALVGISGYTSIIDFVHSTGSPKPRLFVYYKIATGSESAPTVDITPLGTGNTVIAQIAAFRGVSATPIDVLGSSSENASAQNIGAITGITPVASNGLVIVVGMKCDDWTSVADLSGDSLTWVEIGEPTSVLGQDAGLVWGYAIYSGSPPTISSKTFTVTGGVSQKGLGVMFSVNPYIAPTTYPPRPRIIAQAINRSSVF